MELAGRAVPLSVSSSEGVKALIVKITGTATANVSATVIQESLHSCLRALVEMMELMAGM